MMSAAVNRQKAAGPKATRRRPGLSAKARAALKLQGQYMGYMRQLKPHRKARVRKIREAKGVRAAVNQAKHLAHS